MSRRPTGRTVRCPACNAETVAVIPKQSQVVDAEENADGKVWITCRGCGERFLVFYRTEQ